MMSTASPARRAAVATGIAGLLCAVVCTPVPADAFCGFYVAGADTKMYADATNVVMMREGQRTVLSMQNNYAGPPRDFALVIPVPVVLEKDNVKVLPRSVFDKVDTLAAPRLVEYWEQDPCAPHMDERSTGAIGMTRGGGGGARRSTGLGDLGVEVKAKFAVGEYDIVILSAKNSGGLETWLRRQKYKIPAGAAKAMRPYVSRGMYFFVAKVNVKKVTFDAQGQAKLSPLRFHYDAKEFSLPVRLGLLNARGAQDLIVHILARNGRYQAANYPNVNVPTNLVVSNGVRGKFGEFYAALLDRTLAEKPGAVVTEYAWSASSCDPCPGPTLSQHDLLTLGADTLDEQPPGALIGQAVPAVQRVSSNLDKVAIRRVLRRHRRELVHCYEAELIRDPTVRGTQHLSVDLPGDGKNAKVKFRGMGGQGGSLAKCVQAKMPRWRWPATSDAKPGSIRVKLRFSPRFVGGRFAQGWTLTRLHARYSKDDLAEDLVFERAAVLQGGRGVPRGAQGEITTWGGLGGASAFQGRYIILNAWDGAVACDRPRRGIWGGNPVLSGAPGTPATARNTAFAPRGKLDLAGLIRQEPAAAGVPGKLTVSPPSPATPAVTPASAPAAPTPTADKEPPPQPASDGGCGCTQASRGGLWRALASVLLRIR
jgi:hypothetical protein